MTITHFRAENGRTHQAKLTLHAGELASGDVLQMHDWQLHVLAVDSDVVTDVRTAEFDFLLHFAQDAVVDVVRSVH
jgi:hypothetical protein